MNEIVRALAEDFPHTWRPMAAILAVLIGVVVGRVVASLLGAYARRVAARVGTAIPKAHSRALNRYAFATALITGIYEALQFLEIPDRLYRASSGTAFALGVLSAALLARTLLVLSLGWYAADVAMRTRAPVDTQFIPLLRKLATVFIFCTGAVIVLKGYGYDISTLVVSLGVGSLALGLAMQQTLANMIAGFTVMLDRPFRIGDRVTLSTGEAGDVVEIGLRSTRIVLPDLSTLIIPNTQMVNERILNESYPDPRKRPLLSLGVAYGTDLDRAKKVIASVLESERMILREPPAVIQFAGYGESSMNLNVRFTVSDFRSAGAAVDAIGAAIERRFREEGIEIPFPTRAVVSHGGGAPAGPTAA